MPFKLCARSLNDNGNVQIPLCHVNGRALDKGDVLALYVPQGEVRGELLDSVVVFIDVLFHSYTIRPFRTNAISDFETVRPFTRNEMNYSNSPVILHACLVFCRPSRNDPAEIKSGMTLGDRPSVQRRG